jgi:hypothetical protein
MQQAGVPVDADQQGGTGSRPVQMNMTQGKPAKAPTQAAFGTSSGAAVVFRDFASI